MIFLGPAEWGPVNLYLNLLKSVLCNTIYDRGPGFPPTANELSGAAQALARLREIYEPLIREDAHDAAEVRALLSRTPEDLVEFVRSNAPLAYTLGSRASLDCAHKLGEDVLSRNVPGDFLECGVWRGGQSIFMRGLLKAHGDTSRCVWLADSFAGLPRPDPERSLVDALSHEILLAVDAFRVSQELVEKGFACFDLLDEQVRFLPGWFHESLPTAPVEKLALLRLDGDYYESTVPPLVHLYPKLSPGGLHHHR